MIKYEFFIDVNEAKTVQPIISHSVELYYTQLFWW